MNEIPQVLELFQAFAKALFIFQCLGHQTRALSGRNRILDAIPKITGQGNGYARKLLHVISFYA
jgi:hypothetical protein